MDWVKVLICVLVRMQQGEGFIQALLTCLQPVVPPPCPPEPPPTPPGPDGMIDPVRATVKYSAGGVGCTATVLAERPNANSYWVLTAAHCVRGTPGTGIVMTKDGKQYTWRAVRTDQAADLALLVIDTNDKMWAANIAPAIPLSGTKVWHKGYGVDKPDNREDGQVIGGVDRNGQIPMRLSVSPGDSGSGIFRDDNGELVSVVCCAGGGVTYGGSVIAIHRLLEKSSTYDSVSPSSIAPYVCREGKCHEDGVNAITSDTLPFAPGHS